ncbi:MAG TPA: lysophospholipid acyltransferase family protein, partial [Longimicrobiaceae bacterium]|nr:lysophospholipid acyltransferase family protein [Longimicrobiaceae bacterium]
MIRTLWVYLAIAAATVWYGGTAIVDSLFRSRVEFYIELTRGWARAILRASATPVVAHGLENVRAGSPQVVVSNHVSWYDIFAIASVVPVPFHFVAKKELESIPLFGRAWKTAGHISIDRSDRRKAIESLRRAGAEIRARNSAVVIFPEGTRSRTGRLQPFKKGAFTLAVEAGVPIVPTVVVGSYDILRPDDWRVHPSTIHVHFGEPVSPGEIPGETSDQLMERVRQRMVGMLERLEAL